MSQLLVVSKVTDKFMTITSSDAMVHFYVYLLHRIVVKYTDLYLWTKNRYVAVKMSAIELLVGKKW